MAILQHALVTLLALAAGAVLFRRVFGVAGTSAGKRGCTGCPSARRSGYANTPAATRADVERPAVLIPTSALLRRQTSGTPARVATQTPAENRHAETGGR